MLKVIRDLLTQPQVRKAVEGASNRAEAAKILVSASATKGHAFGLEGVIKALAELTAPRSRELNEQELLLVSGGLPSDSAPKLCHTDSCGGTHATCC